MKPFMRSLCAAKKKRILFFAAALLITLAEIGILYGMGISIEDMRQNVILFSLLFPSFQRLVLHRRERTSSRFL